MASGNGTRQTFNDMIQADRKKRKNQELAQQLLGSGRRLSDSNILTTRKAGSAGTLASRVGVTKASRSITKPTVNGQWAHDLRPTSVSKRTTSATRVDRGDRLEEAIERDISVNTSKLQANIEPSPAVSWSIKGKAHPGPFCVVATNFVPGTTAADIEMAFQPHGEEITSCRLVSTRPQVTAELVFPKREHAENVVNTFNNSVADGKQLYVYVKQGPPSTIHNLETATKSVEEAPPEVSKPPPQDPPSEEQQIADADVTMEVDETSRYEREERKDGAGRREQDNSRSRRDAYRQDYRDYPRQAYQDSREDFSNGYGRLPASYRSYYGRGPRYEDRAYRGPPRWR